MPIVPPVPIPQAPDAPQRNDPTTFEERNDAAIEYQFNTLPGAIDQQSEATYQNALEAKAQAESIGDNAAAAEAARDAAAGFANDAEDWSRQSESASLSAWSAAAAVGEAAGLPAPLVPGNVLGVDFSGTVAWVYGQNLLRSERASSSQLTDQDRATLVDIISGTFTQTFAAPATLGDGWHCYLRNSGTGSITIPASDGRTNWIMYPGECRLFQCDGAVLRSIVISAFAATFTSSGNFIKPPGYKHFAGLAWSAGASGIKDGATARGGGGGGCFPFNFPETSLGSIETITIGAGGAPSTTSARNAGGDTSFGSLLTVIGADASGQGGAVQRPFTLGPLVGPAVASAFGFETLAPSSTLRTTVYGGAPASISADPGGYSIYGGAAGGGFSGTARAGGLSVFGGNGGACGAAVSGTDGTAPGGGGGGTNSGPQSGAGARGELRIWGII